MSKVKMTSLGIGSIILLIVLSFAMELGGLEWKKFFAPKHAAVEREVFTQTRSFNEAKKQELVKLQYEYMRSKDDESKKAIAFVVRNNFADYDKNKLSPELRDFINEVTYR